MEEIQQISILDGYKSREKPKNFLDALLKLSDKQLKHQKHYDYMSLFDYTVDFSDVQQIVEDFMNGDDTILKIVQALVFNSVVLDGYTEDMDIRNFLLIYGKFDEINTDPKNQEENNIKHITDVIYSYIILHSQYHKIFDPRLQHIYNLIDLLGLFPYFEYYMIYAMEKNPDLDIGTSELAVYVKHELDIYQTGDYLFDALNVFGPHLYKCPKDMSVCQNVRVIKCDIDFNVDIQYFTDVRVILCDFMPNTNVRTIDLSPLRKVEFILGKFFSDSTISTLDLKPLNRLRMIGNDFLSNTPSLKSIGRLNMPNLKYIGDRFLYHSAIDGIDLSSFTKVISVGNLFLARTQIIVLDVEGLKNLKYVGDDFLRQNEVLQYIDLSLLRNLEQVGTGFLSECPELKTFSLGETFNKLRDFPPGFMKNTNKQNLDLYVKSETKRESILRASTEISPLITEEELVVYEPEQKAICPVFSNVTRQDCQTLAVLVILREIYPLLPKGAFSKIWETCLTCDTYDEPLFRQLIGETRAPLESPDIVIDRLDRLAPSFKDLHTYGIYKYISGVFTYDESTMLNPYVKGPTVNAIIASAFSWRENKNLICYVDIELERKLYIIDATAGIHDLSLKHGFVDEYFYQGTKTLKVIGIICFKEKKDTKRELQHYIVLIPRNGKFYLVDGGFPVEELPMDSPVCYVYLKRMCQIYLM